MPRPLTEEQQQQVSQGLERTDSAPAELNSEMLMLAHQLSQIHGRIRVSREASGIHFYMASPACLIEDDKLAKNDMPALFCRVGRQNTPLVVITLISLLM